MTDGVARDLEQAEARLAAARLQLEYAKAWLRNEPETWDLFTEEQAYERVIANYRDAAIEVGRLRALAEVERLAKAATAYREAAHRSIEYQSVAFEAELYQAERDLDAALAAREEMTGA